MRRLTTSRYVIFLRSGIGVVALATLAALAGCGARSSAATVAASPAADHTVTATRSGTSRSAAGVAIDQRIARDAQLRRSDFPSGWSSSPRPAATTGGKCPGIRDARAAVDAHARSREFAQVSGGFAAATADSAVYIYADTAGARHWFAHMSSRDTRACLVRVLGKSTEAQVRGQGATLDSITARRVSLAPAGDEHAADRIVIRLTAGGVRAKVEADVIFVQVGRGIAAFALADVGGPPDQRLETKLVRVVTGRLAAGLQGAG
ncbi:MAG TPA: hypothetical protein VLC49_13180 [Solirubrobacteraceae bacterium]|nr:hypothetical protein [Solirubrobacteraceae bacterium]